MKKIILAGFFVAVFWAGQVGAEMVVIVNKGNAVTNLSSEKLARYFKGLDQLWDGGSKVVPVELTDSHPLAGKFTTTIMKMDLEKKRAMWIKAVFSGQGVPPQQFKDDASVVSFVAKEPGAVGYVSKSSVTDSVKIVSVDGKSEF